jgi:hypothetical protein
LNQEHSSEAIKFFLVCREVRETIEIAKLCDWARQANTEEQKTAVIEYLVSGERRNLFADSLNNNISGSWMQNDSVINQLLEFYAGINNVIVPPDPSPETDINLNIQDICNWWNSNNADKITDYNKSVYPIEIDEMKSGLSNEDRETWLILFFLGATHTLGRNNHEQHRNFIKYCLEHGWWDIFSFPKPQNDPTSWMRILNEYHDLLTDKTEWYIWMEKYCSIYQIAKYLDVYRDSFLRAERINYDFDLSSLTNPRTAADLSGSGLDAPPLKIGIGANFVIRELVRLGIIKANKFIIPHCFVPKARTRQVPDFSQNL